MWSIFKKTKKAVVEEEYESIWKTDFSDCVAADYIPNYSVCQTESNRNCRHVIRYSGMLLCSHKEHKSFIPEGAPQFDPHKGQF